MAIQQQVKMLRRLIETSLPIEKKCQLAQGIVRAAEDPRVPYSQALGQNLRRFWHEHFPIVAHGKLSSQTPCINEVVHFITCHGEKLGRDKVW